ncbi:hypothetical protein CROQUDRAFT_497862 [Cronartium quercuum f. sp. fusiforme G11]|uniref:Uncharacterized protein n=1 Tax=Cronartium quercuum f. sp. fusiforme G11 TaxID=708437 RepID=A0A9P6NMP1_9BASI|nr:hypothetical protein CROQUDRAFT_497862 [Cronartium quercuum f. sp. fusiforme G11]
MPIRRMRPTLVLTAMSNRHQSSTTTIAPNRHRLFYRQFVPPMLHCLVLALTTYTGLKLLKQTLKEERTLEDMYARRSALEEEVAMGLKALEIETDPPLPLPWWKRIGR